MTIRLLVFDAKWTCLLDRAFSSAPSATVDHSTDDQESMQLIMGMLYSLKNMLGKLAPASSSEESTNSGNALKCYPQVSFSYETAKYRLLYYEVISGWKFVLLLPLAVSPSASCVYSGVTVAGEACLQAFYSIIFVEYVVKNPLVSNLRAGDRIKSLLEGNQLPAFKIKMEEFFNLPIFSWAQRLFLNKCKCKFHRLIG